MPKLECELNLTLNPDLGSSRASSPATKRDVSCDTGDQVAMLRDEHETTHQKDGWMDGWMYGRLTDMLSDP